MSRFLHIPKSVFLGAVALLAFSVFLGLVLAVFSQSMSPETVKVLAPLLLVGISAGTLIAASAHLYENFKRKKLGPQTFMFGRGTQTSSFISAQGFWTFFFVIGLFVGGLAVNVLALAV